MSTCSPVTLRTTSGPVTKMRPAPLMMTMSVSAGPYAAPPAAGPSTTEICGTRPDARTIAAKTWPTASSATTPSARRAPPECHRPTTGTRSRTARSIASTMCRQPSVPMAPPMRVASVAKAMTGVPSIWPRALITPESSRPEIVRSEPRSKRARRRTSGSRWSTAASSVTSEVMVTASSGVMVGPGSAGLVHEFS